VLEAGERERLVGWLDAAGLPGAGEELTVEPLAGGATNEVYKLGRGGESMVLRRPPVGSPARAKTIAREARVLGALAGTEVPHAALLGFCEDEAVLGAPFYVMELVDGWSPASEAPRGPEPFDRDPAARAELGREIVRGIALLGGVDWRARGLEGFGRPDGFHERQVERWSKHLEGFAFRPVPGLDQAAAWLSTHKPRAWEPGIMHGDYSFANVMFRHGAPGRLAAIVDWEMTTIGDPLLDLGWLLMRWPSPDGPRPKGIFEMDGMPTPDEVLGLYEESSGRSVADIDYYLVLAYFKNAIVLEGRYAAFAAGEETDPKLEAFGDWVLEMAALAGELSGSSELAPAA
jgi:aminoglycoside phosphotransferase (APT) family kinase protein